MKNLKVKASRNTIIILSILFLVLGGTGSYLLWRVNQQDTVAPTDSEAGGDSGRTPSDCCYCPENNWCSKYVIGECETRNGVCKKKVSGRWQNAPRCTCTNNKNWCYPHLPLCCVDLATGSGASCGACLWPLVAWYDKTSGCTCRYRTTPTDCEDLLCKDGTPNKEPDECPAGYIDMQLPVADSPKRFEESSYTTEDRDLLASLGFFNPKATGPICQPNGNDEYCFLDSEETVCIPCKNPYWVRRMCKKTARCGDGNVDPGEACDGEGTPCTDEKGHPSVCDKNCGCITNTCDGGVAGANENITLSTTTPPYCGAVDYAYVVADSDGVKAEDVKVELDSKVLTPTKNVPDPNNSKRRFIEGTIPGSENCDTNTHTLRISWKDIYGNEGGDCSRTATYTPQASVCDGQGKGWIVNPGNKTYQTCRDKVDYKLRIGSSQGVDLNSIQILIGSTLVTPSQPNGHPTPTYTPEDSGNKTVLVEGSFNAGNQYCLSPGKKTLRITWKAVGETAYSSACDVAVNFTVIQREICDGKGKGDHIIFTNGRKVGENKYVYNHNEEVQYEYIMGDSKEVNLEPGDHYPKLQVGTTNIIGSKYHPQPTITPIYGPGGVQAKQVKISGKLNTSQHRLSLGEKTMSIFWKRVGETTDYSAACQKRGSFTMNTCDGEGRQWKDKPSGTIYKDKAIPFKYITGDTDGVDNASITVLLDENPVSVTKNPLTNGRVEITGELSSLDTGTYTLQIMWKDIYGAGNNVTCYAKAPFEVVERPVPDWDIDKVSAETCVDDGTENPKAKITNTITVTNNGTGVGSLKSIVDTLDEKVVDGAVSDISHGGVYAGGKITWTFETGSELANYNPGQSKTFTYSYIVEKDKFGLYNNRAVATTVADNTFEDGASIEVRCNVVSPTCGDGNVDTERGEQCDPPGSICTDAYGQESVCTDLCACPGEPPAPPIKTVPETGLLDKSQRIMILGAVILFTGLGWTWMSHTYSLVNGKLIQRRKEQFEQRVVKK
ncbi:MAG: hypothetical protein ACOX06_00780 [Candidatus Dojkabacteria bacterium]|jgi:hypothetical protein